VLDQPFDGIEDRVVFDRRRHDARAAGVGVAACPEDALDRQVVTLGATRGEDDLRRPGAQESRQCLASLLHPTPRGAARRVQGGRVADRRQGTHHRLDRSGVHRGRGSVI
jgi:hypothetical protein